MEKDFFILIDVKWDSFRIDGGMWGKKWKIVCYRLMLNGELWFYWIRRDWLNKIKYCDSGGIEVKIVVGCEIE